MRALEFQATSACEAPCWVYYIPAQVLWVPSSSNFCANSVTPFVNSNFQLQEIKKNPLRFIEKNTLLETQANLTCPIVQEDLQFKNVPKFKNNKFTKPDAEYSPSVKKVQSRGRNQNKFRNIVPNLIYQIFSYLEKPQKSGSALSRIIDQEKLDPETLKNFYIYQKLLKAKANKYISEKSLKIFNPNESSELTFPTNLFTKKEQEAYRRISLKLIEHFLRNEAYVWQISSKRMSKQQLHNNLAAVRFLRKKLKCIVQTAHDSSMLKQFYIICQQRTKQLQSFTK